MNRDILLNALSPIPYSPSANFASERNKKFILVDWDFMFRPILSFLYRFSLGSKLKKWDIRGKVSFLGQAGGFFSPAVSVNICARLLCYKTNLFSAVGCAWNLFFPFLRLKGIKTRAQKTCWCEKNFCLMIFKIIVFCCESVREKNLYPTMPARKVEKQLKRGNNCEEPIACYGNRCSNDKALTLILLSSAFFLHRGEKEVST